MSTWPWYIAHPVDHEPIAPVVPKICLKLDNPHTPIPARCQLTRNHDGDCDWTREPPSPLTPERQMELRREAS